MRTHYSKPHAKNCIQLLQEKILKDNVQENNRTAMKELRTAFISGSLGILLASFPPQSGHAFNLRDNSKGLDSNQTHGRTQTSPVVQILNSGTSGSGVVIGESEKTYTVATAYHVVSQSSIDEVFIELENGNKIKAKKIFRPLPDADLAFLTIDKTSKLPVAVLPFLDKELWEKVDNWPWVYVVGYSASTPDAPESILRSDAGTIESVLSKGKDGYNLLYKDKTVVGMSGGGIFGETQVMPFIKDPFAPKKEYFYHDLTKDGTVLTGLSGNSDWQDGKWDDKQHHPFQNAFYAKCMSSPQWQPEFSGTAEENGPFSQGFAGSENWKQLSSSFNRSALCKFGANMSYKYKNCKVGGSISWFESGNGKNKDPDSFLLLAIHGRAERSDQDSANRTGSALGVYLGSPEIKNYLEARKKELGLRPAYAYASRVCKLS